MVPKGALVLYRAGEKAIGYIELFQVDQGRLHSPRRVTDSDMDELVRMVRKKTYKEGFSGLLPQEVFALSGSSMGFYLPAGVRRIFMNQGPDRKSREALVWLPAMVFFYRGPKHELKAFWCKGSLQDLREDKAVLTAAPMPNISYSGLVCLGSSMTNTTYRNDAEAMMEEVIERFFSSSFNEWRHDSTRMLMERCQEIAAHPDPEEVRLVEPYFWKHLSDELKQHIKNAPWSRPSQFIR